jgi:hypothetical protein
MLGHDEWGLLDLANPLTEPLLSLNVLLFVVSVGRVFGLIRQDEVRHRDAPPSRPTQNYDQRESGSS